MERVEAVKGLIVYQDRALFLEAAGFSGGRYDIPGGRKNNPQEDDETALQREVREEVGLEIEIRKPLNAWSVVLPDKGIHIIGKTYLCTAKTDRVTLSNEHMRYRWVPVKELSGLDAPEWLREAFSHL